MVEEIRPVLFFPGGVPGASEFSGSSAVDYSC